MFVDLSVFFQNSLSHQSSSKFSQKLGNNNNYFCVLVNRSSYWLVNRLFKDCCWGEYSVWYWLHISLDGPEWFWGSPDVHSSFTAVKIWKGNH